VFVVLSTAVPQKKPKLQKANKQQNKTAATAARAPDVVVPPAVDALPPEVAVLRLQEGGGQALHLAAPHAHKRAAVVEAAVLVQRVHLQERERGKQKSGQQDTCQTMKSLG
jgi:hypothetical protein